MRMDVIVNPPTPVDMVLTRINVQAPQNLVTSSQLTAYSTW